MNIYARTLCDIALFDEIEIAPGLFYAVDHQAGPRVHNGTQFRGYANQWSSRKGAARFQVQAWGDSGKFTRRTYTTLAGAVRALKSNAIKLDLACGTSANVATHLQEENRPA